MVVLVYLGHRAVERWVSLHLGLLCSEQAYLEGGTAVSVSYNIVVLRELRFGFDHIGTPFLDGSLEG